jgi:hypothetical protein
MSSILIVCDPAAAHLREKTMRRAWREAECRSTRAFRTPSTYTRARPRFGPRLVTHATWLATKVCVADAPGSVDKRVEAS